MKPSSVEPSQFVSHHRAILIVDDEPTNLQVLSDFLNDRGFEITIARSGAKAIERIRYAPPDLILMDVAMPGMDGFETCRRLKAMDEAKDIPVLFLTAMTSQEDKVKGFQAGGVDYITKPIQFEELLARVQTHLSLRAMHRRLEDQNILLQQEVAERKRAEEALHRYQEQLEAMVRARTVELAQANRMLRMLSACNQIVVRATEESALLEEICRVIVDLGGYPRVWIAYINAVDHSVHPAAQKGFQDLASLDGETRLAAVTAALDSLTLRITGASQEALPFSSEVRSSHERGAASVIALPLCEDRHAIGVLTIYAEQPDAFHQAEVDLLLELTDDLAYGIISLRMRAERKKAEEELRKSEARYRDLFEEAPNSLWEEDFSRVKQYFDRLRLDGVVDFHAYFEDHPNAVLECAHQVEVLDVNQATLTLVGAENKRQLIGSLGDVLTDEALKVFRDELVALANGQMQFACDETQRTFSGELKYITLNVRVASGYEESLGRILVSVLDITERKHVEKEREAIYQISQAAISADSLETLYSSIHRILATLLPAENFYIAIYDSAGETFNFPYYVDQFDSTPVQEKGSQGLTGHVFHTGRPLLITAGLFDTLQQQHQLEPIGTPAIDWLGVPLKVENRLIGVMVVQSYSESIRYGKKELSIMEFVSAQIAMVIERKQSEDALHHRLKELTVLHAVALAAVRAATEDNLIEQATQILSHALYTDNFGVLLFDEEANTLRFHPSYRGLPEKIACSHIVSGENIIGSVASSGDSWLVPYVHDEPVYRVLDPRINAELCVPMKVNEQVIGVINAESVQRDAFTEADKRLLETVASQLATAIKKVRLFDETNRHILRLNALHTVDKAITGGSDLKIMLDVLLDQALGRLEVDAGDILILNLNTQVLEYITGRGFRTPSAQQFTARIEGPFRCLVLEREALYIPDLADGASELPAARRICSEGFVSYYAVPFVAKGQVKGIIEIFHRSPLQVRQEWVDFVVALAAQAAIAVENTALFEALQRSNQELTVAYDATLEGWSRALELRDQETEGHSQRVTSLTIELAKMMGFKDSDLIHIRRGALLHDIGKMGIPDSVLLKSDALTDAELAIMRRHPVHAFSMLSPIPYLNQALAIPLHHHEKWDGTGYPTGLRGEQIPLAARIFAVVDVWDALISDRPYRKAWTEADALEYIRSQAGSHFDPRVVEVFLALV
ncbi:MAG: GAF domain-containing protein [Chloroflexota bacterium]